MATSKQEILVRNPLDPTLQKLYDRHKSAILYSSFIEGNKLNLGYKRNKIVTSILKKQEEQRIKDNVKVKPFSLALKYWNDSKDDFVENEVAMATPESINSQMKIDMANEIAYSQSKGNLIREMKVIQSTYVDQDEPKPFVNDWMNDYDIFDDSEGSVHSTFGTPDLSVPVSKIPCYGCGALLQCADSSLPGYLPSELFKGKSYQVLKVKLRHANAKSGSLNKSILLSDRNMSTMSFS